MLKMINRIPEGQLKIHKELLVMTLPLVQTRFLNLNKERKTNYYPNNLKFKLVIIYFYCVLFEL